MSFNGDGVLDAEEMASLIRMASNDGRDIGMVVKNNGADIVPESLRSYFDGAARLDVMGYHFVWYSNLSDSKGKPNAGPLIVVRRSDAASASLMALLQQSSDSLLVVLSAFKASGDKNSQDMLPTFEYEIREARLSHVGFQTDPTFGPCEVLIFSARTFELRTAPQLQTGIRGAVRTFHSSK
jgi:hypothetical protein